MATFDSLVKEVLPYVPGCPNTLVETNLRSATIELCEKSKAYVAAALSMGQSEFKVMFKHILPNSLVPIITYFPFAVVAGISALVGLDFLGFGLAPPTPSWGQMLDVGLQNIRKWWMVFAPVSAQFLTLLCIVFIGEGVREAFDPKVYSRLR